MEITSITVVPGEKNWDLTRDLFVRAFPADEREPLEVLNEPHKQGDFRAFFMEGRFCGLAYMLMDEVNCYLFYLAVEDDMRGGGVGSAILREIRRIYPTHKIVLEMETLDPKAENYEDRLRRDRFYKRNGMKDTSVVIVQCGVPYAILCTDEHYTLSDYREMWVKIAQKQGKRGVEIERFLHDVFGDSLEG
ncbi:MAG: GNAT family N-acetyltransferase [Bacteroidia bacterium]|nr:GNAT family N-acetyltransferase [Bacteroidia bacterium]